MSNLIKTDDTIKYDLEEIFDTFYENSFPIARRYLQKKMRKEHQVFLDDFVQDAYCKVYRYLKGDKYALKQCYAYLYRTLNSIYIDFLRKKSTHNNFDVVVMGFVDKDEYMDYTHIELKDPIFSNQTEHLATNIVMKETLKELLSHLAADEQYILIRRAEGYKYDEICEALKIQLHTAKTKHHRAITKLRKLAEVD